MHRFAAASALLVALAFSAIAATSSRPGPPGLCASIDIGSATSLPLGADGNPDPTLDPAEIRKSLPSILGASRDPLLHMETIRRASLYAARHPELVTPLILELQDRVLAAESKSSSPALAWLDAGYFLALMDELGVCDAAVSGRGAAHGADGYAYILHAATLAGETDPALAGAIQLAGAYVTFPLLHGGPGDSSYQSTMIRYRDHLAAVERLAPVGSSLRDNLGAHRDAFSRHLETK